MGGAVITSICFVWKNAQKNAGLQGSTLSDHHMTTGFCPFELPTCGLLQRGQDHSPPKACFRLHNHEFFSSLSSVPHCGTPCEPITRELCKGELFL